jgi:voltage-gated potassium channel
MERKAALKKERNKLLVRIENAMEGPLIFLGFVWLILLIIELIWGLSAILQAISYVIWIIFIIDFIAKLLLAPEKWQFLKTNWLTAISLIIPALRVVRILRVIRLLRGVRLIKIVASVNRSMKSLGATMKRRGFGYVIALTIAIIFAGAAGMYAFENGQPNGLTTYGAALWWTAMLLTSLGSEYWPQTAEGQALCLLLGIYGFCVFGYITATLASFFVGRDAEEKDAPVAGSAEVKALEMQVEKLTQMINELKLITLQHYKQ